MAQNSDCTGPVLGEWNIFGNNWWVENWNGIFPLFFVSRKTRKTEITSRRPPAKAWYSNSSGSSKEDYFDVSIILEDRSHHNVQEWSAGITDATNLDWTLQLFPRSRSNPEWIGFQTRWLSLLFPINFGRSKCDWRLFQLSLQLTATSYECTNWFFCIRFFHVTQSVKQVEQVSCTFLAHRHRSVCSASAQNLRRRSVSIFLMRNTASRFLHSRTSGTA